WDISLVGRKLTIRESPRKILLDLLFDPPSRVEVRRARLRRSGAELLVFPDGIRSPNGRFSISNSGCNGCRVGINIGEDLGCAAAMHFSVAQFLPPGVGPFNQVIEAWEREFNKAAEPDAAE